MKKYTIEWSEVIKTGTGANGEWKMTKMNLKDEAGEMIEGVTTFDPVMTGGTLEGEIVVTDKGYKNFKKAPSPKAVAGASFKAKQIDETMQRKEKSIERFQDSKEFSIMVASSMSQAVNLAIAELGQFQTGTVDLEKLVLKWRDWVIAHWNVDKTDTPAF